MRDRKPGRTKRPASNIFMPPKPTSRRPAVKKSASAPEWLEVEQDDEPDSHSDSQGGAPSSDSAQPAPRLREHFKIELDLLSGQDRIDTVLLERLRAQSDNLLLKNISRLVFKDLFKKKRVRIKGQPARPASSLASGTTVVELIGFKPKDPE